MPKKGENIYKRKDGRWEGRYIRCYDENQKIKYGYVYARTYRDVKYKLKEKSYSEKEASHDIKEIPSYNQVLDAWLRYKKFSTKESSYVHYLYLIDSHIRPYLGPYKLSSITTQIIERYVEEQLCSGRLDHKGPLSPKTVTDIMAIVKSSFQYAKDNHLDLTCNIRKLTIRKKEKDMRVLSKEEQASLVSILVKDMDLYKFGVLLSLFTGIRIGELCALKWEDISLTKSIIKIKKTMQRIKDVDPLTTRKTKIIITEPKSKCSVRDIPLPLFLKDYIKSLYCSPQAFVLTGSEKAFVEPRVMQYHFQSYIKESGITHANFHALRHTFATRCVEVGFELKSLSEILGHANVNITLNKYVHSSFELKSDNMNKLSLYF